MGAAMRRQCCGGRDDDEVKSKAKDNLNQQNIGFLHGEAVKNDLALFDEAHENNDVVALVNLLDSPQPFARNETQIHPWAAAPRTVGSLAAFQLASMASKEGEGGAQPVKEGVREAGGIPKLVKYLESQEDDRKHAAVVALSFLALDNDKNCVAMFEAGALPLLTECIRSPPDAMRGAAADTARNIYALGIAYRQAFVAEGGVGPLVSLLDLPVGPYKANELFNQSEAIFHIEDLILESAAEIPMMVKAVKDAGAAARLEALTNVVGNAQLQEDAKGLLVRLAD